MNAQISSRAAIALALALLAGCAAPEGPSAASSSTSARAPAASLAQTLSGSTDPHERFDSRPYLRFDMLIRDGRGRTLSRESILFDFRRGLCRYEADAQTFARLPFLDATTGLWQVGDLALPPGRFVALLPLRPGSAVQASVTIDRVEQPSALARLARQRVEHARAWLLLPLLARAPGVTLHPLGPTRLIDGSPANEAKLTLGPNTPLNPWRIMLAPDTGRIIRTQAWLEANRRALGADWRGLVIVDDIRFCPERRLDDGRQILFDAIAFPAIISPRVWIDPGAPMP